MTDQSSIDSFGVTLFAIARAWRLKLDQRLRPLGLSQAKWRTILAVHQAGEGVTQKELAERLAIEGPSLVRLLDRLAADGWIERRACQHDRRSKRIHLLSRARCTLKEIEAIAADLRQELLGDLPQDELGRCLKLLNHIGERAERLP